MQKKECKKLLNELIKNLDALNDFYYNQLTKNNTKSSMVATSFKLTYDIIKSEIETFRDRKLDSVLNKIDKNRVNKIIREEKEDD